MSIPPTFPNLPGLAVPLPKRPRWNTRIAKHESGREVRTTRWKNPIWDFEVSFEGLTSADLRSGLMGHSQQIMTDFFQDCRGAGGVFLYVDPRDTYAVGQALGIGDGVSTDFIFKRMLRSFNEKVGWVLNTAAVYANGVPVDPSLWDLVAPSTLRFVTPPTVGTVISADFYFAFLCRFSEDEMDMQQYMDNLWEVRSLKFQSVRSQFS